MKRKSISPLIFAAYSLCLQLTRAISNDETVTRILINGKRLSMFLLPDIHAEATIMIANRVRIMVLKVMLCLINSYLWSGGFIIDHVLRYKTAL